jgi:transposase
MMIAGTQPCARCADLEQRLEQLCARVAQLEAELAAAKKNSTNSSKPPSSDIVKKPKDKPKNGKKRKRGGQPGHPRHERPLFPDDQVDYTDLHW